ncbi:MAG: NDP-sugar synthase [Methanobacteriota archaeon]|nr:MAG: NDP-sugar synthase [Euryarchaeota archaeon]
MKAVLLVGGKGTRLRPLTCRVPKPLIPVVDKPLMLHVIDSLPDEVDEVVVPVGYKRDVMEDYLARNPPKRRITIVEEREPMGTGGAVKNVEEYIDGPFLVVNGDSISSLNMRRFVAFHREKKAFASISLWEVDDPTPFGIVDLDEDQRIRRFQEKPTREEAFSKLVNAGVYALEYEALDHIGEGFVSMEREVFPKILDKGMYGLTFDGYWVDCGTRESLLDAFWTLMAEGGAAAPGSPVEEVGARDQVFVGEGSTAAGAELGPRVYLASRVHVGEGSKIENSVVFDDARIGRSCRIANAIIDEGVTVPDNAVLEDEIVVRDGCPRDE